MKSNSLSPTLSRLSTSSMAFVITHAGTDSTKMSSIITVFSSFLIHLISSLYVLHIFMNAAYWEIPEIKK